MSVSTTQKSNETTGKWKKWLQSLLHDLWYRFCYVVTGLVFFMITRIRVKGSHHVPRSGAILVLANHQSYFDPPLVGLVMVRETKFLGKKSLFKNKWIGKLFKSVGGIPLDIEGTGKEGIKEAIHQLQMGYPMVVFPEGSRTMDGAIHTFLPGILLLLRRAKVPILPIAIAGAYEMWPPQKKLPRIEPQILDHDTSTIAMAIGKPIPAEPLLQLPKEEILTYLQTVIQNLKEEAEALRIQDRYRIVEGWRVTP